MQSKITVGLCLAACVASCLAKCQLEVGGTAESYLCEGIDDLKELNNIPVTAQRITILNSRINTIPEGAFSRFSSGLVYLNITRCPLDEIQSGAFHRLNQLSELVLDHNYLKSIKANWIKDLTNLKELRVWDNAIAEIEPEVFDNLKNLELLDLAYNNLTDCLSAESLAKIRKLKTIYFSRNPWPLRCRAQVIFHLEKNHIPAIHTWGSTHILVEECLAHNPSSQWKEEDLKECVNAIHPGPFHA